MILIICLSRCLTRCALLLKQRNGGKLILNSKFMPRLVLPSIKYKRTYLQAKKEFERTQNPYGPDPSDMKEKDFVSFLRRLKNHAKGKNLPPGYIPYTVFWLVEGNRFLGIVSIRHQLNPHLKKMGGHIGYSIRPSVRRKGY